MRRGSAAFLSAPFALVAPAAQATVYLSVAQAQQVLFPGASFVDASLTLTDAQAQAVAERAGVRVRSREQRVWRASGGGWLLVDQVIGKSELITYAVALDADGRVRGVEIMEYRESHGYEVRNAGWRKQFSGKSAADPLRLEQDIRNISGATLSCRHITEGVRRLLALHDVALKGR